MEHFAPNPKPTHTLLVMRHAKSSWDDPNLHDFERPLNARGRQAAQDMAPLVSAWQPQWIACSNAKRTRQTLLPALEAMDTPADITITNALYASEEPAYLRLIRSIPNTARRALIIGHNPAIEDVCRTLIGLAEPELVERLAYKLPTGTLIAMELSIARWSDLGPQAATLVDVVRPRDLA